MDRMGRILFFARILENPAPLQDDSRYPALAEYQIVGWIGRISLICIWTFFHTARLWSFQDDFENLGQSNLGGFPLYQVKEKN